MADNLNGIPFSTSDEGVSYPDRAKKLVEDAVRRDIANNPADYEGMDTDGLGVYVVWFAYTLGNWKALCSTNLPNGRYYEVTRNLEKKTTYIDTYVKIYNEGILG